MSNSTNSRNTINYTNNGLMVVNAPSPTNSVATNGAIIIGANLTFGSGFQFDLQTTNLISHAMAGTFYNNQEIRCDSIVDGNNIYTLNLGNGSVFNFYFVSSLGQF